MHSVPVSSPKVALISLPWASSTQPSIAIGLLKSVLQTNNISCTCFYLENQFYNVLPVETEVEKYRAIMEIVTSQEEILYDWLFSKKAFGLSKFDDKYISRYLRDKKYLTLRDKFDNLIDKISTRNWGDFDYIGLSCTFNQIVSSLALSRSIKKKYPEVKIMLGGAYFDQENSLEIVNYADWVNYVFIGEPEKQLPLAIQLDYQGKSLEQIKGIVFRDKPICNPAEYLTNKEFIELPIPNYDEYYSSNNSHGCGLEASRGCWYGDRLLCTFCSMVPSASYRIDHQIVDKILWLKSNYDISFIQIADLVFPTELIEPVFSNTIGLDIDFWLEFRVDTLQPNHLYKMKLMKQGGVKQIFVGIESLHPKILKSIKKGHLAINAINVLKWGKFYGLEMQWNWLYRIPSECPEYYDELLNIFKTIIHLSSPQPIPIAISKGSEYANTFKDLEVPWAYKCVYPSEINLEKVIYEFKRTSFLKESKFFPNKMIKFMNLWSNRTRLASLTKLDNMVYDDRYVDHRATEISDEEVDLLDYCQLPRKKRILEKKFNDSTVSRMVEKKFMIFLDNRYLTLIEPENDSIFYDQQHEENEQFARAGEGKKAYADLHVL